MLASLQPSVRLWVEQQAKIEARRSALDVNALRTAIVQRFAGSLPAAGSQQPSASLEDGGEVAEMAVLVILMMVQDGDRDLQAQMQAAEAQLQAKQALRATLDDLDQLQAQVLAQGLGEAGQGASGSSPCGPNSVCITSQQLASVVAQSPGQARLR